MNASARTIFTGVLALVVCVGCVLVGIYPFRPAGVGGWVALVVIAVPIVGAYEFIGDRFFSDSLGKRMSKSARISYGVVVALAVVALSWLLFKIVQPYLTTWGG